MIENYRPKPLLFAWWGLVRPLVISTVLALSSVSILAAQTTTMHGQLRPRYEYRNPVAGQSDAFISMRVRADIRSILSDRVRTRIQIQDVRTWGEETNTLGDFSADNFDLHQGFIELQVRTESQAFLRVGRQEISLGGQRLIGAVDWTQQGRAFDGARYQSRSEHATVDAFGFVVSDVPGSGSTFDASLTGVHAAFTPRESASIDVFGLYDRTTAVNATNQVTLGIRSHGKQGESVTYRVEGAYQLGERMGTDVAAFMLGARIGSTVLDGDGSVTLWFDYLSGDDDPADAESKVFSTLYATNHKFYGFADLFLNIPVHTGGLGLQDLAVKGTYRPRGDTGLTFDFHTFRLAKQGSLASAHLGEEFDVGISHQYEDGVTFSGGLSYVFAGAALNALGRLTQNMTYVYFALNTVF
jgi:hypothetical protein